MQMIIFGLVLFSFLSRNWFDYLKKNITKQKTFQKKSCCNYGQLT